MSTRINTVQEIQISTHSRKKKKGWLKKHRRPGGPWVNPMMSLDDLLTYSKETKKFSKNGTDVGRRRQRDTLGRDKTKYERRNQ